MIKLIKLLFYKLIETRRMQLVADTETTAYFENILTASNNMSGMDKM